MPIELDPRAKENQELYRQWRDARKDWEDEARKDVDFFLGNHFTAGESSDLSSRNQADIPMDRVAPAVEKFKSMLTAKPPVFTVIPREDSDSQVAQIWRTILGYVWDVSDGDAQMKQAIHDYTVTGLGYLYAYVDNNADFGRGDVKFTYVNPFRVYVPPDCRDRWFTDADGIILSTILTGDQVVNLYPQLGDQVDPETGEMIPGLIHDLSTVLEEDYPESTLQNSIRAFTPAETKDKNWWGQEKYQILERFYPITVPFYRVVDSQTGQESIMDEEAFTVLLEENPGAFERGFMEFEEIPQPRVAVSASLGEVVLYEKVLNIDMYPIVPVPNIWTETPYPKSDVSRARPMQRLLNKLWSLALSHAQASAGLKLIVPMGSVPNIEDLERDWSNPNAVIEVDTTQGEPHYPAPQPLAGEFYRLIQQCEFYIDFSFGVPEMMHGIPDKAPETVRGTERMIALGSERPKSKLRDIEFSINRLGRVLYGLAKGHYTYKKVFTLAQPNNDEPGISVNLYDDVGNAVNDIYKDRLNIGQHDVRIQPGSTLPESKWAIYDVYLQAFQLGLVDRMEVLAKNPEIFDKAGIMQRLNDYDRYEAQIQGLQGQVQELEGDLQTARRESVHDRMRVEVSKLKSKLSDISSRGEADRKVKSAKMDTAVKLGERDIKDAVKSIGGD
jgi:hypothetical protein|tara:strand:- start:1979 stop:3988 length:2010 start_codon:yes stop_codon:yes gene_type:complete